MRHLGKVSIALALLVSGCNMYGAKAQKLRDPVPINPIGKNKDNKDNKDKTDTAADAAAQGPVVEDCEYHERAMPLPKASPRTAEQERSGDENVKIFGKADDQKVKSNALIDAIDAYGRALAGDPFNPEITLKLALAYDKAARKGCALALLGRLNKLSNNEKFSKKTEPVINEVLDRKGYFERYRKDAIRALGR